MHAPHGQQQQQQQQQQPPQTRPGAAAHEIDTSSPKSFSKDGRKIDIGDCALFQAGNAPPFIGILRKVTVGKDRSVQLRVNWLYRPADLELAKGVATDAEPNEIFYSFHQDDTPAASLLHPCKVAFLRRGVELPSGVSAFVCRRVYDITNKRLWWLTDRDYTDEHQEEVDQLLNRTKVEMQAAISSPKPAPAEKSETQNNSAASSKSKKRDRHESVVHESGNKRLKVDESESSFVKLERVAVSTKLPEELSGVVDKDGGLLNTNGVDKLLGLMQQDRNDGARQPEEVASRRIVLVNVIAATDKQECRDRVVQQGGLKLLDDWLQEAHKGKSGCDGSDPSVGSEKVFDELLLTLLRALQKLPVDLDALKSCNVGKSVNNLKSHRNSDIHRKAKKLVDTWKKRVDAESGLTRRGSVEKPGTPGKQENSSALAKTTSSSSKLLSGVAAEAPAKSGSSKSVATAPGSKESSPNNSASNEVSVKEEKSCNWSSTSKEDVKSSSKSARSSAREAKRSLAHHNTEKHGDKASGEESTMPTTRRTRSATVTSEKASAAASAAGAEEAPSSQRLILRIPNPGRSPARSVDPSKVSSPKRLEKGESPVSEKRIKVESRNGSPLAAETRSSTKAQVAEVGMSLLATVAADEILSSGTGSTVRSVVTEEGPEENTSAQDQATRSRPAQQMKADNVQAEPSKVEESGTNDGAGHGSQQKQDVPRDAIPSCDSPRRTSSLEKEKPDKVPVAEEAAPTKEVKQASNKALEVQVMEETPTTTVAEVPCEEEKRSRQDAAAAATADPSAGECSSSRPLFDLNEGLPTEESLDATQPTGRAASPTGAASVPALTTPIPVMASSHSPFVPPASSNLKLNRDIGWKGTSGGSAFRPAEPRCSEKKGRPTLEFDLNVVDEGESTLSQPDVVRNFLAGTAGNLAADKVAFDLNQADESEHSRLKTMGMSLSTGPPSQPLRNFDLNDGPSLEDAAAAAGEEDASFARAKMTQSLTGKNSSSSSNGHLRGETLNLSSWFPVQAGFPGAAGATAAAAGRGEQQGYAAAAAAHSFSANGGPDLYHRGSSSYQQQQQGALYSSYPGLMGFPFAASSSPYVNALAPHQQYSATIPPAAGAPSSFAAFPGGAAAAASFARPAYVSEDSSTPVCWGRNRGSSSTASEFLAGADAGGEATTGRQQVFVLPLEEQQMLLQQQQQQQAVVKSDGGGAWDVYRNAGFKWRL